ncbi:hypothetical protein CWB41_13900 [Methylovirgula ligni]|uniref:DUF7146 domain-containing protein n=1 Tax=Methylovirgula ligni TaxID=569860 RepID=A0A3D9YQZ4_9HYPH|nr:hypothetical protein [Methylovirgula ligni]QAY96687.1 hypothetical protein CWB41_13900 [Methylovirgula ligni]REF83272.1 hypothetical protein DES32_3188 [Methylovirgula ligni]
MNQTLHGLPPSTRARMRIKDILRRATQLADVTGATPAARYLQKLDCAGAIDLAHGDLYAVDFIQNWACGGSYFPALIAHAHCGEANAIEATFLTPDGDLARVKEPKLLLGTPLGGATVRISTDFQSSEELWIARSIETGCRAAFAGVPRNVVAGLRMDNIAQALAIEELKPKRIFLAFSLHDETPLKLKQRVEAAEALRDRGFEVRIKVVDELEGLAL